MPTTTPATTPATTAPPRRWEPSDRVRAVVDQIGRAPEGHVTLSVFDPDGAETVRLKEDVLEVGDPTAWLRAELEVIATWHAGTWTHLRLRLWAPGGVPVAGVKFPVPSVDEVAPLPERVARPTASRSVARADIPPRAALKSTRTRIGSSSVARHPERPAPASTPPPDHRARAERLEQEVEELRARLYASEQRVREIEAAFDEVVAERDAALADAAELVAQVEALADALEAA
jgi:hypothetical protein